MLAFGNLLNIASKVIPHTEETVEYYRYTGIGINSIGISAPTYDNPVNVKNCHLHAATQKVIELYGFQPGENVRVLYMPVNALGTMQKTMSDKLVISGKKYNIRDVNNWYDYDGWNKLIIVEDKEYNGEFINAQN